MIIANKAVLVTGANRGIGRALVEEALRRGAKRVYAGTRQPLAHPDGRVTPLTLDITNKEQIQRAVKEVESLDVLVNNAGVALISEMGDRVSLEEHLAINLFGPYDVTQAFLPLLIRSRGAVVNNLSMNALAPMPLLPGYSAAKAAAFSLTQSSRTLFARQGVSVHAVLTGPVDTDAARGFDIPKASPESVARAIFDGVENEEEDIFPDLMSQSLAESWRNGSAKGLERMLARRSPTGQAIANAVGPGPTDTDALNATLTHDVKKVCISRTPLGRLGTLSDIADVVAFLASPDARWVTGHTLFATGWFMPWLRQETAAPLRLEHGDNGKRNWLGKTKQRKA